MTKDYKGRRKEKLKSEQSQQWVHCREIIKSKLEIQKAYLLHSNGITLYDYVAIYFLL